MMILRIRRPVFAAAGIVFCLVACLTAAFFKSAVPANTTEVQIDVPIIMYHSVLKEGGKQEDYIIAQNQFEEDLKFLQEHGYTSIFMKDLIDYVYEGTAMPDKPVILTFDDGYYNNYTNVFPLLQKYHAKAVISIIGTYTELYSKTADENEEYAHLNWEQIKLLQQSGCVEIQNHTYYLHENKNGRIGCKRKKEEEIEAYQKMIREDIEKLQDMIEKETGGRPTTFTYPYGRVSIDSLNVIKEMAFQASLSCEEGVNYITGDKEELYLLKRFLRPPQKSVKDILKE